MKYFKMLIIASLSFAVASCSSMNKQSHKHKATVLVYEKEITNKTTISAKIKINELNRIHAIVSLKTPKRNGTCGNSIKPRSRNCRKKTVETLVSGITVKNNNIFFNNNGTDIKCGFIKDKGLRGKHVVLNNSCRLESSIVQKKIDNGINISTVRVGTVSFNVEE